MKLKILALCSVILILLMAVAFAAKKSGQDVLNNLSDPSSTVILNDELRRINQVLIDHENRIAALEP